MATVEYTGLSFDCPCGANAPTATFYLLDEDAEHETVAQRLRVALSVLGQPDDNHVMRKYFDVYEVTDAAITTFDAGDAATLRALLAKVINHSMNEHDL